MYSEGLSESMHRARPEVREVIAAVASNALTNQGLSDFVALSECLSIIRRYVNTRCDLEALVADMHNSPQSVRD